VQRAAAERILRQLQEDPDTWTRVVTILQNSQNSNSKFYALQVLAKVLVLLIVFSDVIFTRNVA
jgi:exportin-1